MITNRIRIETCTLHVSFVIRKKRKSFLLCVHFSFQGVTPWNSRCTGLKNRNQQTYHAKGCSRAKAMNYWDKHAQTASAGSNDMPPFTSHQLWVLSINTSICSQLQWTVRKKVVGRLLSWERCPISHGTCAAAPREDWMTFGRLVYACAVLGLTALCCDAWMWAGPVMREYVFVLNCVSVPSSIYLGQ